MRDELKIGLIHLAGACLFAMVSILATTAATGDAWRMIYDPQLGHHTAMSLGLQAAMGASTWFLCALGMRLARRFRRQFAPAPKTHRIIAATRGSAMVETLIAMPVVFLFSFGLVQFALNNVAAVMVNYAPFTASRAAWVWEPEGDLGEAAERARIAAAVSLTPVAYGGRLPPAEAESQPLMEARGLMVAAQFPTIDATMAERGVNEGDSLAMQSTLNQPTMANVLGDNSFMARSAQQMTAAHRSTIVEVSLSGDDIETMLRYQHFIAMPLVGEVFGELGVVQGKTGYWMLFERSYSRERMTPSNRNIDDLVGSDNTPKLL